MMNKRLKCPHCDFILSRCLCETLRPIDNATHLIILQHPSETTHALNTVKLMKKSFLNITLLIGEDFSDHEDLNSIIKNPLYSLALLYPTSKSSPLSKMSQPEIPITHLILLDGTWKKAHKIYTLSRNLHQIQSNKLELQKSGDYRLRTSHLEHSLSTLEASLLALNILEEKLDTSSLSQSFKKMIDFQIEKMGSEIYKKNYLYKKKSDS